MKRVLFVDDEPMVLQGLQRMLRGLRGEYEMEFVDSGSAALARMEEHAFDVVVSDMRMPGMNGAQLLQEIRRKHPQVVRLILSGHADRDLILQCVGTAHQYLAKPCQADALKSTIRRASVLEARLPNELLRQLVTRMRTLPSFPTLYSQIMEKLQDPEAGLSDVVDIISRDPGMTAKILKLVNSAFFGMGRPLTDIQDAVGYLGIETVKSLVLSMHVFSQFQWSGVPGFSVEQIWVHSMQTASIARTIVQIERGGRQMEDEAFVAGLLHDVGKLVLATNFPALFVRVWQAAAPDPRPALELEEATFKANHADIGGYLLGLWGLPVRVVEAIALHHTPGLSEDSQLTPLASVHIADALCHEATSGSPRPSPSLDLPYLKRIHLLDHVDLWRRAAAAVTVSAPRL